MLAMREKDRVGKKREKKRKKNEGKRRERRAGSGKSRGG